MTTSLATVSKPCDRTVTIDTTITPPGRNGAFSVTLQNGTSKGTTTASLDVLIPPTRTDDVTVKTSGTTATFKWRPNPEADLTMYELVTPSDKVITSVTASSACKPGHHCKAEVDLGQQVAGKTRLYAMRAVRCGLSCTGTDVIGPPSVSVAASFTNAPPATPTPTPPTGGTTSTGGGGYVPPPSTGTGSGSGNGTGGGSGNGSGNETGRANGGRPRLHPTKQATPPTTGSTRHHHEKAASVTSVSTTGSGTAVRGVATALILLLIAAHVISWASRTNFD